MALAAAAAVLLAAATASADRGEMVIWPTVSPAPGDPQKLRRPDADEDPVAAKLARQLDVILGEAAQDLGLVLDVSQREPPDSAALGESELVAHAGESWLVSPRIEIDGETVRLRILVVPPGSRVILVRVEETTVREFDVRAMAMLRDLVVQGRGRGRIHPEGVPAPSGRAASVRPAHSEGRAVLGLNGAVLGGYIGLSLQRATGSEDARLMYPLMALGTGVGLGASMIAASEWGGGMGDAWYLSAGTWWPAAAGLLLADSYDVRPVEDRYVYGLVGAAGGATLATVALSLKPIRGGGALLTHSGGAWGTAFGALIHMYSVGETDVSPTRGMGYGAGIGVVAAGIVATQVKVKSSRVLLIDMLAGLGALTGAAVASPVVFGEDRTHGENRAWLFSIAAGSVVGAAVGLGVTGSGSDSDSAEDWPALPYAGVVAEGATPERAPLLGGGVHGVW
jgi:hypothetical protein